MTVPRYPQSRIGCLLGSLSRVLLYRGLPCGAWLTLACAILVAPARAVVVYEPTVLGPTGSVHHVNTGGFEAGYDWVETQGIDNPEVNAGFWEAPLTEGAYQVEAFIPKEVGFTYARYLITHATHTSEVRLRQSNFANEWVVLGDYAFDTSQSSVRSTDSAGYPGEQLAWSDIRFTPLATLPPNVEVSGATTTINEPQIAGPEGFVVRFVGVGFRGDLLRVYARGASATAVNSATWTLPLAAGQYAVEAFIPKEHAEAEVSYTVHALTGDIPVTIPEKSYNNLWVPLGNFHFGTAGASVLSTDSTAVKEEEIAWDALRFKLISLDKTQEKTPETQNEEPGVRGPTPSDPLVSVPPKPFEFSKLRIRSGPRHHRRAGPKDLYSLTGLPHSDTLTLRYRCAPCLMIRTPLKLRPHSQIPLTRTSTAQGDPHRFLGLQFYKGTILQIEIGEPHHRALLYTYRFPGAGRVDGPAVCVAAPGPIGPCAP